MEIVFGRPYSSNDVPLSDPSDEEEKLTRRILRPQFIVNEHNPRASVKATIMHQKRHSVTEPWRDADSFNAAALKAGQEIRLHLKSGQTLRLFEALERFYGRGSQTLRHGDNDYMVVRRGDHLELSDRAKAVIEKLMEHDDEQVWDAIDKLNPGLLEAAALKKQHEFRSAAVDEFEEHYNAEDWTEQEWENFFRRNMWIFGHSLSFCFLSEVVKQPYFGGTMVTGRGGQRGDFLMATNANARFTVLVDIKTPEAQLVEKEYRNKVYLMGKDVVGGVSQLQSYCRRWVTEGSKQEDNVVVTEESGIYTYEPKAILVVGDLYYLDDRDKRASFEMFRRNIHNPEIITYDELLARAKFIVKTDDQLSA